MNLRQFIHNEGIKTVSFDVFDTIVFRRVARPVEVFTAAFDHFSLTNELTMSADEFKELRVYVEKQVKRQAIHGEVSLEDIFSSMPFSLEVVDGLKQAELDIEKRLGFIYQPMNDFIAALVEQGIQVFLVSDMYLSKAQIRQCFFADYPLLQSLPLHVSSEYKLNKSSGLMFDHLAEQYSIEKSSWLHLGDNLLSDFTMPKQKQLLAQCLSTELDVNSIFHLESTLFPESQSFNSARMLASTHFQAQSDAVAFNIGSLIWGPILFSFTDWVIDQTIKAKSSCILCLMREAEVFAPLIENRLQQRNLTDIVVKKLYASRKSTFWPAIDTQHESWFEDLIYVLVQRRGYTVDDFYRDFLLSHDEVHSAHKNVLVRDTDGLFFQGQNLLKLLTDAARANSQQLKDYVHLQRALFSRYFTHHIGESLDTCTVVDLGNGGTIQHQIEAILNCKSAGNLLFYSSERIYRFSASTRYSSFINAHSDSRNLRQLLSRSPECIEPFLVGDCGTTLGYQDDTTGTPILAAHLPDNSAPVNDFLNGVVVYFRLHHQLGFGQISTKQIIPILYRYIQLPSKLEAQLFTRILHQDNFGSNDAYPIITDHQREEIEQWGLADFYQEFCQYPKVKVGKIHWPQAVITLISERFLARQLGLMSMDTDSDVLNLVERLLEHKWRRFSVYGAGLFFEKLLPYLQKNNLQIDYLIDRKADISGPYNVAGFEVVSLDTALAGGTDKVLISSYAFKDEIARNIYEQSIMHNSHAIDVLSL
ncbi:hypothetical protein [Aliiglaciecola sp. LCG003]|uniref:HAD family hydrolase n=1 Tax=Aliiglaciecola sp. LCG003 TaxID=3053655 RepID=UPI0025732CFC|nr:hypothetical protein [Aliiglaciecola sp. LCG003]WJG10582.1 hypothetical protein QR722_05955 [Aliiglaciecola sp. LCG003]